MRTTHLRGNSINRDAMFFPVRRKNRNVTALTAKHCEDSLPRQSQQGRPGSARQTFDFAVGRFDGFCFEPVIVRRCLYPFAKSLTALICNVGGKDRPWWVESLTLVRGYSAFGRERLHRFAQLRHGPADRVYVYRRHLVTYPTLLSSSVQPVLIASTGFSTSLPLSIPNRRHSPLAHILARTSSSASSSER